MITFPSAKINLGLNITSRREDGYHNLETVFFPIDIRDVLEIKLMDDRFPCPSGCDLHITGLPVDGAPDNNLITRAYRLLASEFKLPRVHAHLFKHIPMGAGLGGGSSDAAAMLCMLDERFRLNLGIAELERYAAMLGADCAFFVTSEPTFATGIGNELSPLPTLRDKLNGLTIVVAKPDVHVSTKEAYAHISPKASARCCRDIVTSEPVEAWRHLLTNDFEAPIFASHPELAAIKQKMYDHGALFAQMSGSGSAVFGLFEHEPEDIGDAFAGMFCEASKI